MEAPADDTRCALPPRGLRHGPHRQLLGRYTTF